LRNRPWKDGSAFHPKRGLPSFDRLVLSGAPPLLEEESNPSFDVSVADAADPLGFVARECGPDSPLTITQEIPARVVAAPKPTAVPGKETERRLECIAGLRSVGKIVGACTHRLLGRFDVRVWPYQALKDHKGAAY